MQSARRVAAELVLIGQSSTSSGSWIWTGACTSQDCSGKGSVEAVPHQTARDWRRPSDIVTCADIIGCADLLTSADHTACADLNIDKLLSGVADFGLAGPDLPHILDFCKPGK